MNLPHNFVVILNYASSLSSLNLQALKVVCQDMFFSRARGASTAQDNLGATALNSRSVLEQALTGSLSPDDRINAIGELVQMRVDKPTYLDFSETVSVDKGYIVTYRN